MPFTFSTLISSRTNRIPSSSKSQRTLYLTPASHNDRHTIPSERLHISFSDPVLVSAEQKLFKVPDERKWDEPSITKVASTTTPMKIGSVAFHLGSTLPQRLSHDNDGPLVDETVANPVNMMAADARIMTPSACRETEFHQTAAQGSGLSDLCDYSCDISEVVVIPRAIDGLPGSADVFASDNSRRGTNLVPLASEMFKQELYTRGYLKRPTIPSSNIIPRGPRTGFVSVGRKVFTRILGKREGRKVADGLKTGQGIAEVPANSDSDAHVPESHTLTTVARVTIQTPHIDGLESPGTDANTSTSEVFDLHEFSYITAFTTPPSSPAVLGAEAFKKGGDLGNRKHAV